MSVKSTALAAEQAAQKQRKAKHDIKVTRAAVAESARIREMFAEDRKRLEKRYGVISAAAIED